MRQGEPLSPYLFLMVLKILAIHICIVVEDKKIKLCAFVDALATFLPDMSSYSPLVESLNRSNNVQVPQR